MAQNPQIDVYILSIFHINKSGEEENKKTTNNKA